MKGEDHSVQRTTYLDIKLKYQPLAPQLRAHLSSEKHILYGGAVGGGKSVYLVNDALRQSLMWSKNRVGIFRWEFSTFKKTTYLSLKEWVLDVPGLVVYHNQQEHIIRLVNGSEIVYGGLKPSSSVSGDVMSVIKSLELSSVYIDEVTDVPEEVFLFLSTRTERHKALNPHTGSWEYPPPRVAGTCNPELGWVKLRWVDSQHPDHVFIPSNVKDNIHLPASYEAGLREIWADNPEWVDRYLEGNWTNLTDFEAVLPADKIMEAVRREVPQGTPVIIGVDCGAFGNDKSVAVVRRGLWSEVILEKQGQSTMETANQVALLADRYLPERIRVDTIGVGQGVGDRLAEMGYPVEPFIAGAKAEDDRFLNKRAEAYWGFRNLLEKGLVSIPNNSIAVNEMGVIRYMISASDRKIQIESKKLVKKRLGHSPDYADAFIITFDGAGFEYMTSAVAG